MANRRIFLKNAGALALGTLVFPACSSENKNQTGSTTDTTAAASATTQQATSARGNLGPIGLQLYSVKDVIEADLKSILQQLGAIGYKEIESYPGQKGHYFGYTPAEFKSMLNDAGMELVSSHFGSGTRGGKAGSWQQATLLQNFDGLVEKAAQTGQKYLTCSSLDGSLRKTPDDLKRIAGDFNKAGETCKKAGLQFAYHNHAFEFEKVGNTVLYDYLLENTDPELVKYELDMYWVVAGNQDPAAYLNKYPNRFPLGHVKDMDKGDRNKNTEVGTGSIKYADILKTAKKQGMKHFFVEQESFTRPSMESMRMNYAYLNSVTV
jgi:sugar phosphate isomerase/epimerase